MGTVALVPGVPATDNYLQVIADHNKTTLARIKQLNPTLPVNNAVPGAEPVHINVETCK